MKKYLLSGAEMDIVTNETGGFDVTVIGPHRAFESIEEALSIIYNDTIEVYNALKAEGILSKGSIGYIPPADKQKSKVDVPKPIVNKGTKNRKTLKKQKKSKTLIGVPPADQKVIKTPSGGYLIIPDTAKVEIFGTDKIETTGNVKTTVTPNSLRAFTAGGKRYVAGFNKAGKFAGYYLSSDMNNRFVPDAILYQNKVDDKFINKLLEITYNLGLDPNKLMAVMAEETGEKFDPKTKHEIINKKTKQKRIVAVGLTQFTQKALDEINRDNGTNYTIESVLNMTAEEQLDLVEKFYNQPLLKHKTLKRVEDYGIANFAPADAGKGQNNVIYTKNTKNKNKIKEYNQNASLDVDKDGNITNTEAGAAYKRKYVKK